MATHLVYDVETTFQKVEGKRKGDPSPFNPKNKLVSAGWCFVDDETWEITDPEYRFFYHQDLQDPADPADLQAAFDQADGYRVGHNVKFDDEWALETGFSLRHTPWDTMVFEYIFARGEDRDLSLDGTAKRRKAPKKLGSLPEEFLADGIGFDEMPMPVVEKYGKRDVWSTAHVFCEQMRLLQEPQNAGLWPTVQMQMEFIPVLTEMERNGIAIDWLALEKVEKQYAEEKAELQRYLREETARLMGDTPINLASPEHMSRVVYSRRVTNKQRWAKKFRTGTDARGRPQRKPDMTKATFGRLVKEMTEVVKRTKAKQCPDCGGDGYYYKEKKDGTPYKNPSKCKTCTIKSYNKEKDQWEDRPTGLIYEPTGRVAGLKMTPQGVQDTTSNGFATNKDKLEELATQAKAKGDEAAEKYLRSMVRLNAVETYLSSFVGGIKRNVRLDCILHPSLNQTITATGRLSSSNPNFQNQPRGKTFPVRKAVTSRFEGGSILEGDYGQLEFRSAAELSGCAVALQDILDEIDVHAQTSSILTDAGQETDRQAAKPHTFKPLYGGTSGTPAEQEYYKAFLEKYHGIKAWHEELQNTAIEKWKIVLPTGREYAFKGCKRMPWGGASGATKIKNYPVQGFATADIVPNACILLHKRMKEAGVKSLLINTVHDSIVVDVFPGEEEFMIRMMAQAMLDTKDEMLRRYNLNLVVPLQVELKIGPNWLEGDEFLKADTTGAWIDKRKEAA